MELMSRYSGSQEPTLVHLYYSGAEPQRPLFFRNLKEEPSLTQKGLLEDLKNRVVVKIEEEKRSSKLDTIITSITAIAVISLILNGFSLLFFTDPVPQPVPLCSGADYTVIRDLNYSIRDSNHSKAKFDPQIPCDYDVKDEVRYAQMPTQKILHRVTLVLVPLTAAFIATMFLALYKKDREEKQGKQQLDVAIKQLSYVDDLEAEIPAKDIKVIFPYLSKVTLVKLKFLQLKKAWKHHKDIFLERLKKSEFSKQQLAIWRLFDHLIGASRSEKEMILEEKISRGIIGSDPDFFELVVRTVQPLQNNEILHFSDILEKSVLTDEAASLLNKETLQSIVINISKENPLADLVEAALAGKELIDKKFSPIDLSISSEIEGDEEKIKELKVERFLKKGKLTLQNINECYELLKIVKQSENEGAANEGAANFLEKYLIIHLEVFLQAFVGETERQVLLDDIHALNLEKLKTSIDAHLNKTWKKRFQSSFDEDLFYRDCLFAKKNGLTILAASLQHHYTQDLNDFALPEKAQAFEEMILKTLQRIDELFEDQKPAMLAILEDRIDDFLTDFPNTIEQLATLAEENDNLWLKKTIIKVYKADPDHFSSHWLSPFEDIEGGAKDDVELELSDL